VALTRNERPIPNTPFYFSANGEYAYLLSKGRDATTEIDRSLNRIDIRPQIRIPFTRLQWLTVNTSATWNDTLYSRSYDVTVGEPNDHPIVDRRLNRTFFTVDSQIRGPVFNRIWDTPNNGYAEKFKHTIEPYFNVRRMTAIDNYDAIVKLADDWQVGGTTQYTYGLTNRLYAKRRSPVAGQPGQARTILTVELQQSYYTNEQAARVDSQYTTSNGVVQPSHFSPLLLTISAQPTPEFTATARAEFDSRYRELRQLNLGANYSVSPRLQANVGWSKRAFIAELPEFNDKNRLNHALNGSTTVRTRNNKYGATYSFNYDVLRGFMIQQRMTGYYNAQCCGAAFEYQTFQFGSSGASAFAADHRFFMSFTLAGLGNFSPFNGALGGVPR
jgi:hypothetical protein